MRIAALSCAALIACACALASVAVGIAFTAWAGFALAAASCAVGALFIWKWIRKDGNGQDV